MSPSLFTAQDCDRFLIIDDTDDNITEILTVVCERSVSSFQLEGGAE